MYKTNQYLLEKNIEEPYTTYVASLFIKNDGSILISGMGDSRIYGISNQYINQHSKDDKSMTSNALTKCLGAENLTKEDFTEKLLSAPEDRILLCSDGFYHFLEGNKSTFFELLNFSNLKNIKNKIVKEVKNKNSDDATYILINLHV